MGDGVEHTRLEHLVDKDLGVSLGHLPRFETGTGDRGGIIEPIQGSTRASRTYPSQIRDRPLAS